MTQDVFLNDFLKHAFGMQDVYSQVSRLRQNNQSFPPYNISVDDLELPTKYVLEMAVAGFKKDHVQVKVVKGNGTNQLVIEGSKPDDAGNVKNLLVQGLANRAFRREFSMSDSIMVSAVDLADGILKVVLVTKPESGPKETILQIN